MPLEVHISDVKSFKSCRLRWSFASPLRHNLEPKAPARQLFVGTGIHFALDSYVQAGPDLVVPAYEKWLTSESGRIPQEARQGKYWEDLVEDVEMASDVLKHYILWSAVHDKGLKFICGEYHHTMKLPGMDATYTMRADGLLEYDGKIWVIEWKSCANFPSIDELWRDEQNAAYVVALQYNRPEIIPEGKKVAGTVYTFLRKKRPSIPKTLQSGELSHAQLDTSVEFLRKYLDEKGVPQRDYSDLFAKIQGEDKFFKRAWVERTPESLAFAFENLMAAIKEMLAPDVAIYPSPDWWKCSRCPFSTACVLIHNRADPWPLLNAEFRKREARSVSMSEEKEGGE